MCCVPGWDPGKLHSMYTRTTKTIQTNHTIGGFPYLFWFYWCSWLSSGFSSNGIYTLSFHTATVQILELQQPIKKSKHIKFFVLSNISFPGGWHSIQERLSKIVQMIIYVCVNIRSILRNTQRPQQHELFLRIQVTFVLPLKAATT